eukprot:COSAG03_NODE_1655_length_3711_cov_4.280731_3_plen_119_part_00
MEAGAAPALTPAELRSLLARGPAVLISGHPQKEYDDVYRKVSPDSRGHARYRTATGRHIYYNAVCGCWAVTNAYVLRSRSLRCLAGLFIQKVVALPLSQVPAEGRAGGAALARDDPRG